jgi:uncharacterized protein (DUF1330 family)
MFLVVTLRVRRTAWDEFRQYERAAARIMRKHGGALERAVVIRSGPKEELVTEIHLVRFPDDESFGAYRRDPELLALAPLRQASVVATDILVGDETTVEEAL